jgi:signal transduction histidine kinase
VSGKSGSVCAHERGEECPGKRAARLAIAHVAHDINNPLAAVIANLEVLASAVEGAVERAPELSEAREPLSDCREAAQRIRAAVAALRARG